MKVTLTGAAGFIGSHTCKKLLDLGHEVVGIDNFDPFYAREVKEANLAPLLENPNFSFHEIDIRDSESLGKLEASDVLIHLAAKAGVLPSTKDPSGYVSTNIDGTLNLLEWMRANGMKKLLFASSSSVYGNNKKIPFEEDDDVSEPISPYAFTKRSCELMNYSYHHLYNFDILNLRFFTVYGPGQRPDLAIHKFIKRIDEGIAIDMYGDGSTARDYTFVQDTVSGILAALDYVVEHEDVYEIINLGNNQPVKLKELIDGIAEVMGKEPQINQMPKQPGDVDITYASIEKAMRMLGYQPQTSLKEGLQQFLQWYEQRVKA
jgi:nucleoside-diphosphate-sugar epimerase